MNEREKEDFAKCDNPNTLPRDVTRFQKFSPNGRAEIPEDAPPSFAALTTLELKT